MSMTSIDQLRNSLISKLLTIKDKELLNSLDDLVNSKSNAVIQLSQEQKEMIQMGLNDLENNRVISQEDLFEKEMAWLNAQ